MVGPIAWPYHVVFRKLLLGAVRAQFRTFDDRNRFVAGGRTRRTLHMAGICFSIGVCSAQPDFCSGRRRPNFRRDTMGERRLLAVIDFAITPNIWATPAACCWSSRSAPSSPAWRTNFTFKQPAMSSLRKQGPITTDLRCCAKASDNRLSTQPTRRMGPCFRRDDRDGLLKTRLRVLAARFRPSLARNSAPQDQKAQGMPGASGTRSLACKIKSTRASHRRSRRFNPAFPAQWF